MTKKEYLPKNLIDMEYLNEPLNMEVLEGIKKVMLYKAHEYDFFIPVDIKRNIEPKDQWHNDIINLLFNQLETKKDLYTYLVFSLKNEKLGNRILRVNRQPYFLCGGLLYGWCNCTKECYAGKLEHFQIIPNAKNYIFISYIQKTNDFKLLDNAIVYGVNKAIKESAGASLSKIKAIRNNEAGEIENLDDLRVFEYIHDFLKDFVPRLKDYTYSTNIHLLDSFRDSNITVRHSIGFDYKRINTIKYPSLSCIINDVNDLKIVYYHAINNGYDVFMCGGSCKTCIKCASTKKSIIVFVNHDTTTEEQLKIKIKECQAFLKALKGGAVFE